MNARIMQIKALDKKTTLLSDAKNVIPKGSSWINAVREAIGMTAVQLAKRLGVTQPRVAKMEANEENLKLSTMKKAAKAMNCDFVYYFKPKSTFQDIVNVQAQKKAEEINKLLECKQLGSEPYQRLSALMQLGKANNWFKPKSETQKPI